MIIRSNEIYEQVAKENNINVDVIQSIGNCVFQHLKDNLSIYGELAHELPGIGTFNLRFSKFENYFESFKKHIADEHSGIMTKLADNPGLFEIGLKTIDKIKEYREDKKTKRELRFSTIKSSKDNI